MLSKTSKRNIALFAAAFILCGVLHVILWGVDFTYTFSQLFMSILTLLWVLTVQKRVTDARLRKLLLWIAVLVILFYVLQIMKYRLFYGFTSVQRYLWYAYYIPVMAISLLCFYLALYIYRPKEKPLPAVSYLPIVIGVLLALGVLTNDLHFLAFHFPSGILSDGVGHRNGPLFFLFAFGFLVLFILSYWIILRKCSRTIRGKLRFLPVLPLIAETAYCVLYILDTPPRINGINLWNGGEFFGFCMIAFLESCIIVGMIPANKNYEKLFFATRLPAVILDSKGSVVYQTAETEYPFPENDDVKVMRHPISGGSAEWMVDLKQVRSLNQQLEDATAQMEARNAYLAEENRIKQEKAEVETRSRLYDRISGLLKPKLDQIEALLDSPEGDPDRQLAKAAILNAYIKRRSNLELLIAECLDVDELTAAVAESLEYMRLCGVNTAVSSFGAGTFPSEMVIAAYEHIEAIAEESLDTLSDMIVTVRAEGKELIVRMMLKADDFVYAANGQWHDGSSFSRKVVITKDKQDMMILLTFTEGGGAVMSVFPENALLDKTLWALMGLITLFLFLGAVVLFALLVRQKRYRKLWAVLPVILPSYFLYQCICIYTALANSPAAVSVVTWFAGLPGWLVLLTCMLLGLAEGLLFRSVGIYEKSHITPMSVKEATDSMPMGICAYLPGGQIVMTNRAMEDFCLKATGNVLSDGEAFAERLRSGSLQTDCKAVMLGETPVIVLADDTAWALSEEIFSDEKEKTHILRVSDITETYQKTLALRSIQEKVSSLNRRLAKANREIVDLTAAQEVLNAKIKIHDELGSNLLSIRRYLQSGGSKEERAEIVGRLRRNLTFLKGEPEVPADEYDLMMETAARLGVQITVTGKLPQTEPHKRILATAMHECLTNMLRHAGGDELRITITEENRKLMAVFANNGEQPDGEIREKGGLASLRALTEQGGGTMTIRSTPSFAILLELPKEVENAL